MRYLRLLVELLGLSWRVSPRATAGSIALKVLTVGIVAGTALGLRAAVDAAIAHDSTAAAVAAAATALAWALLAYVGGVEGVLHFVLLERTGLTHLMRRVDSDIASLEGLDHLERSDLADRLAVVRSAPWGLMFATWTALQTAFLVIQLAVLLSLLGAVSPWLMALIAVALVPVWFDQRGQRTVARAETDTAEAYRLQKHLFELATAAGPGKEIRVAGAGASLAARQVAAWDEMVAGRMRARLRAAGWKAAGWALFTAAFVGALALVVRLARDGAATPGDVVLTLTVAMSLRESVHMAAHRAAEVGQQTRLVEPYLWLRDYVAAERARAVGTLPAPVVLRDAITLDRVSYTYPGTERPAMDEVSARLPAGAVVAVVGEYGSGKTTLVKLLCKLYRPDAGTIRVDEVDLADVETAGWRARMSAVFQDFGRFHSTVAVAVGLGDLAALTDRERIAEALRAADAEELVARLPDGVDTQLGRELDGVDLSEGQWQKTTLARASMRRDPLLFVLDEPTASLDAPSEHAIFTRYMSRARELAARTGAVTVVVSHRFSTVSGADQILVMAGGRLVETGTHAELLAAGGRYADLYGIQADAYAMG
jgi:ATP-binding cassette subfamily B protein